MYAYILSIRIDDIRKASAILHIFEGVGHSSVITYCARILDSTHR